MAGGKSRRTPSRYVGRALQALHDARSACEVNTKHSKASKEDSSRPACEINQNQGMSLVWPTLVHHHKASGGKRLEYPFCNERGSLTCSGESHRSLPCYKAEARMARRRRQRDIPAKADNTCPDDYFKPPVQHFKPKRLSKKRRQPKNWSTSPTRAATVGHFYR